MIRRARALVALLFLLGPGWLPAQTTVVENTYGGTLHNGSPIVLTGPGDIYNANDEPVIARGLIVAPKIWFSWEPYLPYGDYVLDLSGDLTLGDRTAGTEVQLFNISDSGTTRARLGAHALNILTSDLIANAPTFEVAGGTLNLEAAWSNPSEFTAPTLSGYGFLRRASLAQHYANAMNVTAAAGTPALATAFAVDDDYVRVLGTSASTVTAGITLAGGYLDAPAGLHFDTGGSVTGYGLLRGPLTAAGGNPSLTATGNLAAATIRDEGGDYTILGTGTTVLSLAQAGRSADTILRPTSGTVGLSLGVSDIGYGTTVHGHLFLHQNAVPIDQKFWDIRGDITGAGILSGDTLTYTGALLPTAELGGGLDFVPRNGTTTLVLATNRATLRLGLFTNATVIAPNGLDLAYTNAPSGPINGHVFNNVSIQGPVTSSISNYLTLQGNVSLGDATQADAVDLSKFVLTVQGTDASLTPSPVTLTLNTSTVTGIQGIEASGATQHATNLTIDAPNGIAAGGIYLSGVSKTRTTVTGNLAVSNVLRGNAFDVQGRLTLGTTTEVNELVLHAQDQVIAANISYLYDLRLSALAGARVGAGTSLSQRALTLAGDWTNDGSVQTSQGTAIYGNLTGRGSFTDTVTFNGAGSFTSPTFTQYVTTITAATLNPGRFGEAGTLAFANLTLANSPLVQLEIGGTTPDTGHDLLNVSAALALGGTLRVSFLGNYAPVGSESYDLLNWGSLSGTFAALDLPALADGLAWDTSALYTTGTLGVTGSAIPEPSTYAMIAGLAALGLALRRRAVAP